MWSCRFPSRISYLFSRYHWILFSGLQVSLTLWQKIPLAQLFHYMRRSDSTWFPTYTPGFNEGLDTNSPIIEAGSSKLQTILFRVRLFVFGSFFVSLLRIFAKSSCQFSTSQVLREACSDVSVSPPFGPENFGVSKNPTVFHKISFILSTPKKKHTHTFVVSEMK